MGYTHYWTIDAQVRVDEKKYNKALIDCRKVVKASPIPVEGLPQAGLGFNGTDDESHEDFWLDNPPNVGFAFCKTNRKPYDLIVTACLCVLAEVQGINVSSDGDRIDWEEGRAFAENVLRRKIKNPIND